MSRRVVITGLGMVSPLGIGNKENWDALIEGRSGIGPITRFDATDYPCKIAGELKELVSSGKFTLTAPVRPLRGAKPKANVQPAACGEGE